MTRYLVLSVVLLACSGPRRAEPAEYQRGTYVPIRPAPARPGVGAPVVGQPGYVGPIKGIPRSPYKRILPQNEKTKREDTIWAVKPMEPGISRTKTGVTPFVMDFEIPFVEDPDDYDKYLAAACAGNVDLAVAYGAAGGDLVKATQMMKRLPRKQAECIVARIYNFCGISLESAMQSFQRKGLIYNERGWKKLANLKEHSGGFSNDTCDGVKLTGTALEMFNQIYKWLDEVKERWKVEPYLYRGGKLNDVKRD